MYIINVHEIIFNNFIAFHKMESHLLTCECNAYTNLQQFQNTYLEREAVQLYEWMYFSKM